MRSIMFTGGGSAGHVTVNLALIPKFLDEGWTVSYMGSESGIERELIASLPDVKYDAISTGKLRRYMDWQNVKDPFKVVKGVFQAYWFMRERKPDVLFSKGGFVSVPVVLAAWLNRVPVVIHESDITPGLANRIAIPFATSVCTTFQETAAMLKHRSGGHVGAVIREELFAGDARKGRELCGFHAGKPVLLIAGGSLGARSINAAVRKSLAELTKRYQIVHLCGKNGLDKSIQMPDYRQYEYVKEELPDIMAMADIAVSRAGSNAIFELLALKKPMLLIPLTKEQSRGDQLLNAQSFEKQGYCDVLYEEKLSGESLVEAIDALYRNRSAYKKRMSASADTNALHVLYDRIIERVK